MGRNNADFHGGTGEYQYSFHPAPDEDSSHIIKASHKGSTIGFIKWYAGHGEVVDLEVRPAHRRKGIATELWNQANALSAANGLIPPVHSSAKTVQGEAWARSLGERRITPTQDRVPYFRRTKKDFLEMSETHFG